MKINSSKLIAVLGIMALAMAFFTVSPSETYACDYYDDCYYEEDYCYDDCGGGYSTEEIYIENENINEIYNEIVIEYVDEEPYQDLPHLDGYCSVNVSRAETGDSIIWEAQGSGGDDFYTYEWSGTDGLHSYYPSVEKVYNREGNKTATVEIYSAGETIYRTCSVVIDNDNNNNDDDEDLDGYCVGRPSNPDEDERVTWTVYPEGGDGDYDYDWSGTDGLDGDDKSISKRYDDSGTKKATVRIKSDGDTITRTCTVRVDEDNHNDDDLDAYCKGTPNDAETGDRIKWTVYADGGDGDYDYDWDGDDNLSGDDRSITKTYRTSGTKDAEVRVKSDGDTVTARCHVDIDKDNDTTGGIYLSSIPATGISPSMKITLFATGLIMWSAFVSYLYISRRNEKMKEREVLASIGQ